MDLMDRSIAVLLTGLAFLTLTLSAPCSATDSNGLVTKVLADMPVIDGHNDLPWEIRDRFSSNLDAIDLRQNTAQLPKRPGAPADEAALMTDIPRLRAGGVGAQ